MIVYLPEFDVSVIGIYFNLGTWDLNPIIFRKFMYNETKLFSLLVIQYKYTRDIRYAIDDIRYIIYIIHKQEIYWIKFI